jgi:O-antigen/teichoic acid export membrane protein
MHWAGAAAVPDTALVVWLAIYTVLGIAVNPSAQMLWGLERVGVPALGLALCAVATVKLSLMFGKLWGLSGITMAMTVSLLIYCSISAYEVRRALRQIRPEFPQPEPCAAETLSI